MLSVAVLVLGLTSRATPAPPATATAADLFVSPEDYSLHLDDDAKKSFPLSVPSHPTTASPLATQIQDEQIYKELEEFLRHGVEDYLDRVLERERKRKLRRPMDSPSAVSAGPPPHASTRPTLSLPVSSVDEAAALTAVQHTPRKSFHPPVQNERHVWSPRPEMQLRPMTRAVAMIPYPGLGLPPKIHPPPRIHSPPTIHSLPAIHPPPIIHLPSTIDPPPIIRSLPAIHLPPAVFPQPVPWPAPTTSHPQLDEVNKKEKLQRFMEFIEKNSDLLIRFIANKRLQRQQEPGQRLASTSRAYLGTNESPAALGLDPPLIGQGYHARLEEIPANKIQVNANTQELDFANAGIFGDSSPAGPESFVEDTAGLVATERGVMAAGVMHGVAKVAPAAATAIDRGPEMVAANGRQVEADWREQVTALAATATGSLKRGMIADNNPHHQHLLDGVTRFLHPGERPMTPRPGPPVTPAVRVRSEPRLDENWLVLADGTARRWPPRGQAGGRLQETTLLDGLSGKDLDLLPARGAHILRLRNKERLCQRHQRRPEGPKYHRDGREYRPRRTRRPFPVTAPPRFLIPICCNCCRKSVLSCE